MSQRVHKAIRAGEDALLARGIDTSKRGYRHGWRMLTAAAVGMGVQSSTTDTLHFASSFAVMRVMDDLIDDSGVPEVDDCLKTALAGEPIPGMQKADVELLDEVWASYTPPRQSQQFGDICSLANFAVEKARTDRVKSLLDVTRREAAMFARVCGLDGVRGTRTASAERRFDRWLPVFMNAGYYFDSVQDLFTDRQAGIHNVPPSAYNRLSLAGQTVIESARLALSTPLTSVPSLASDASSYL